MSTTTHLSLIAGLRAETPAAWDRFDRIYRPWLLDWAANRFGFHAEDADEIVQRVMLALMEEFREQQMGNRPVFQHEGKGSFRSWLREVTRLRALGYLRSERLRRPVPNAEEVLGQLATPDSGLSRQWNQQHEQKAIQQAWETIQLEFEERQWRPVEQLLFRRRPTREVADEHAIPLRTLFSYQKAIKERMRELLGGLLDD
jgi:RNA polymerase sigma factor (sigma-70 family)